MSAKQKTCGDCAHTEDADGGLVWCYGAPPSVTDAIHGENGQITVNSYRPLLKIDCRACAIFKGKPRK
jgi:hypothetical protein